MKYILLAFSLLISGASFAQDSVGMVLTNSYGFGETKMPEFARISVSKRIYDLTNSNPKIELVCKYSKDKDLQMGLSKGQIYSTHKAYDQGKPNYCNTTASCSAKIFNDLADWRSLAVASPNFGTEVATNYFIASDNAWKRRDSFANAGIDNWKYAELDNIPMLEIYSPKKHGSKFPRVNGFGCLLVDHALQKYLEP